MRRSQHYLFMVRLWPWGVKTTLRLLIAMGYDNKTLVIIDVGTDGDTRG